MSELLKKEFLDLTGAEYLVDKLEERENTKDAKVLEDAKEYADSLAVNYDTAGTAQTKVNELANGQVKTNKDAIEKLNGSEAVDGSVKKQIKTAKDAIDAKIGTVADNKTLVEMIKEAQTASTYDDTKVKADIKQNADAIAKIENDYLKASDKTEIEGKITSVDGRLTSAESEIDELQTQIGGLTGAMHFKGAVESVPEDGQAGYVSGDVVVVTSTHKEYVYDGKKWHELGDEGSHITKTEVSTTYETKTDATAKLTEAKSYADGLGVKYDAVGSATTAETNAKTYADGLNTAMNTKVTGVDTRVTELESKVADGFTAITTDQIDNLFK